MSETMGRSNRFQLDVSEDKQHKLKICAVAALIVGAGYFVFKCYQQRYKPHAAVISLLDDETPLKPMSKSPTINVHDAVYGLAQIELLDLNPQQTDFQIEINDNQNIRILQFDLKNIELDMNSNKTYIYCRLPLQLKDYFIEFRIRQKMNDKMDDLWTSFSSKTVLKVPSSLISRNFKINENVTFVPKGSNKGCSGRIIKIVDADCTLYVIQETNLSLHFHIVDSSRIYRKGPFLYNVINAVDDDTQRRMDKTVLLAIDGDDANACEMMEVFSSLTNVYTYYAKQSNSDDDVHHVFIGRLIAKYVMEALYGLNQSKKSHLVHCIMQYKHRFMKLVPVWSNSVHNAVALAQIGVKTNIAEQHGRYWCDLCGVEVSRYDWIYRCDTALLDRHFFCLQCIWDIMDQHIQLTQFLKQYLREYLYDVCIAEIASFVCGAVVSC